MLSVSTEAKQLLLKMLVVNPTGRFSAAQLLNDPYLKSLNIRKDGSMGSDLFLSTNESSNVISQGLAYGYNIGHLTVSHGLPVKKVGTTDGWKNFENKVLVNISG